MTGYIYIENGSAMAEGTILSYISQYKWHSSGYILSVSHSTLSSPHIGHVSKNEVFQQPA